MAGIAGGSFEKPDETRTFSHGKVDVITLNGHTVGRAEFEPGWKWSECVKPIAGTDSCQALHVGFSLAGRMHIVHNDGTESDAEAGDVYVIEPGHDAWVVGDETFVGLEFQSAATYAK